MSKSNRILTGLLAAAVANNGTFVVSYPENVAPDYGRTNAGDFSLATGHKLFIASGNELSYPNQFTLTFAANTITVTNTSGSAWPAGSAYTLELKERGEEVYSDDGRSKMAGMKRLGFALINLGSPVAAGVSQIRATAEGALIAGVPAGLAGVYSFNGVGITDVPRSVQIISTVADNATLTIVGTDVYDKPMRENIVLNGTNGVQGKKAFKTVTRVTSSANTAGGIGIGFGNQIGFPVFVPNDAHIIRILENGLTITTGTIVGGLLTTGSNATSNDVRGTYAGTTGYDGLKSYELLVALPDLGYKGQAQFNG